MILKPKDTSDTVEHQKYRPVCHISVMGTLYEQVIKSRLEKKLAIKEGISGRQYRSRKGRLAPMAVHEN